jgi:hypothetical protein
MAETVSERMAIVANLPPASRTAATYTSDVFDLTRFRRFAAILKSGVLGDGGTLQVKVYAVVANAASGGTQIADKTFTAATFSGSGSGTAGGSNHQGIIEFSDADAKAALSAARYGYVTVTVGSATSICDLTVVGIDPRYSPASDYGLDSVAEIIS